MDQNEFIREPLVLCLSRAADIREIRRRVLLTRYRVTAISNVAELEALCHHSAFDLMLLCHTMSAEECMASMKVARACWPGIAVLRISAPFSQYKAEGIDAEVGSLAGPLAMFQAIDRLVPSTPAL